MKAFLLATTLALLLPMQAMADTFTFHLQVEENESVNTIVLVDAGGRKVEFNTPQARGSGRGIKVYTANFDGDFTPQRICINGEQKCAAVKVIVVGDRHGNNVSIQSIYSAALQKNPSQ